MKVIVIIFTVVLLASSSFSASGRNTANVLIHTDTINVKQYGAVGDGVTDDYPVLKRIVDEVNKEKGGVIFFPPGTYYLNVYNEGKDNNVDLKFKDCNGVAILGKDAIISVKGDFKRSAARKTRRFTFSGEYQMVPLLFESCRNVRVEGLTITGNVQKMTRDKKVVEKGQGLITIKGSHDVVIENVTLEFGSSDGIYVGAYNGMSTKLRMVNVRCLNNARQGLSITGLRGGVVRKCEFSNTGFTNGAYGFHRPAAGVDIEPVKQFAGRKTGDILFDSCKIENNYGGQFLVTRPAFTSNVILRNSIVTGTDAFSRYEVILAADSVLVEDTAFDLGKGNIFPTWSAHPGTDVVIQDCTIKSSLNGILSASRDSSDKVTLRKNKFIFTGDTLNSYFPYLRTKNLAFIDNDVYIPDSTVRVRSFTSLVDNAKVSRGNRFRADGTAKKPKVSYANTKEVDDK